MPGWVYTRDFSEEEEKLHNRRDKRGRFRSDYYPWTSISTFEEEERLGYHSHHSDNTHLVVEGTIRFERKDYVSGDEGGATMKTENDRYDVKPGVAYGAAPVGGRISFVEGHKVLSPTTRDRFWMRGDIRWSKAQEHYWKVSPEVELAGDVTKELMDRRDKEKQKAAKKAAKSKDDDDVKKKPEEELDPDNAAASLTDSETASPKVTALDDDHSETEDAATSSTTNVTAEGAAAILRKLRVEQAKFEAAKREFDKKVKEGVDKAVKKTLENQVKKPAKQPAEKMVKST